MRRAAVKLQLSTRADTCGYPTPAPPRSRRLGAWWALAAALAIASCGSVRTDGLGDGSVVQPDARAPERGAPVGDASTSSYPLPGSGGKSVAVWTCSGGASTSSGNAQVGLSLGGVTGAGAVAAPGGATVTLGHFADTIE